MYTPTLSHGCSYERERFDVAFGYFPSAGKVGAETCMRMLYRVRSIRERRYVVLTDLGTNSLPETREALEEFIRSRNAVQRYGMEDGNLPHWRRGADELVYDYKGFYYELYLHVTAKRNLSRNGLARRLIERALEMGAEVIELSEGGSLGVEASRGSEGRGGA